jgi:hypothetical protein
MGGAVALIVAVTGLLGAAGGIIALFRKVQAVHVLVNSQLHEVLDRVEQLTGTLNAAGVDVPAAPDRHPKGQLPVISDSVPGQRRPVVK